VLTAVVLLATATLFGQGRPLLDVPFVAQTPELCGGAAVSMVMRYWGARDVAPEDFASLVVPAERGIPTTDLTAAVRARRWQTLVGPEEEAAAWLRLEQDVNQGRPVIALIEVAAATYHYVVVVGLTADRIVWHDPARSPFRVMSRADFGRAWATTQHWSLLVLPPASSPPDATPRPDVAAPVTGGPVAATPCTGLVGRGVDLALAGQQADAEENLRAATTLCPTDPAGWRELAGLQFSRKDWASAARLAGVAVALNTNDAHARQLLATSRFLLGDLPGALDAWTPLHEPRVESITVTGAERTDHTVVLRASGLATRQLLTSADLRRAERRLGDLPVISRARVSFVPDAEGRAKVDLAVAEREALPRGWLPLGILGARAVITKQAQVDVSGLLAQGERFSAAWRWKPERERVALGMAFPAPSGLPGIVTFDASWEHQTYALEASQRREERRLLNLRLSDWASSRLRWYAGVGSDRFDRQGHLRGEADADIRLAGDRVLVGAAGQGWAAAGSADRFGAATLSASFRSTTAPERAAWFLTTATDLASTSAPLAVWPAAGSGGRGRLLRAQPLLVDDIVAGPLFGRRVFTWTMEYRRPIADARGQIVQAAVFVDGARAWRRLERRGPSKLYVDAGLGLRVATPGGTLRADVAHGLRGGGLRWSAGWTTAWSQVY
jgi:predicted double-glycine peptidase